MGHCLRQGIGWDVECGKVNVGWTMWRGREVGEAQKIYKHAAACILMHALSTGSYSEVWLPHVNDENWTITLFKIRGNVSMTDITTVSMMNVPEY